MTNKFKRESELFYTQLVLVLWSVGTIQEYWPGPLIDPQLWPEGSYELGSILPSYCPFVQKFSWD